MGAPEQDSKPRPIVPFGSYLLDGLIAEGGMARVYAARLRGVGGFEKPLVVKQVRPELAADPHFVRMFVEEANTLVRLGHPHIVPVYELGVVDGTYFLAMERVDGATLSAILQAGPLDSGLVAHLGSQAAGALAYAHERFELVHRDVTPRNVLVDEAGHVRLVDFGIAAPVETGGELYGTPGYMSPEQLRAEKLDGKSDVFALGAVLYRALVGEHAFWKDSVEATAKRVLEDDGPETPEGHGELGALIGEMLRRDPERRPGMGEVESRLRGWLARRHPEGVSRALGERAASAARAPVEDPETITATSRKSGDVQTLATAASIAQLRRESERPPRADPTPERTEPLARARKKERTDPTPMTTPLSAPTESAPRPWWALVVVLLLGAGLFVLLGGEGRRETPDPDALRMAESGMAESGMAESGMAEPGMAESGMAQSGMAESGMAESGMAESGMAESGMAESGMAESGMAETQSAMAGSPMTESTESGMTESTQSAMTLATAMTGSMTDTEMTEAAAATTLTVNAQPWAEATLDGRSLGSTPQRDVAIRGGAHVLQLECPPLGRSVRVPFRADGQPVRVIVDLNVDPPRVRVR